MTVTAVVTGTGVLAPAMACAGRNTVPRSKKFCHAFEFRLASMGVMLQDRTHCTGARRLSIVCGSGRMRRSTRQGKQEPTRRRED